MIFKQISNTFSGPLKKFPFLNPKLTETEMAKELGYDRIWDCGLIKYVYTNQNYKE